MLMFKPLNEKILVRVLEEPPQPGASPLILPNAASAEFGYGEVVDLGAGAATPTGEHVTPQVKPGDKIYFENKGFRDLRKLGLIMLSERQIIGIVPEETVLPIA